MSDDKSDAYKRAERTIAIAERAFPNIDHAPVDPLARAVELSKPSTTTALVPARAAATAQLAREIIFDDDEAVQTVLVPSPPAADELSLEDLLHSLGAMASAPVHAPHVVVPRAPPPARSLLDGHDYFAGIDVQVEEDARITPTARALGLGAIGLVVAAGAIGEGVVAARQEREARDRALVEALENESDEQRARMDQLAQQMGGVATKVDAARDAALKNAQLTAELAIVTARAAADQAADEEAEDGRGSDREEPVREVAAEAERRRQRLVAKGALIEVASEPVAKQERNAVAAAIDRVLDKHGKAAT